MADPVSWFLIKCTSRSLGMYSDEILSISTLVTHVLGNGTNLQSSRPHLTSVKSSNSSQKVTGSVVLSNGL